MSTCIGTVGDVDNSISFERFSVLLKENSSKINYMCFVGIQYYSTISSVFGTDPDRNRALEETPRS